MAVDPQVARIILAYQDQTGALRRLVLEYIQRAWGSLGSYNEADIERFVQAILPVIMGGQIQTAALTDAALAAVETTVLGTQARPLGVQPARVSTEALRGVPAVEVYRRAGVTVWRALADGVAYEQAVGRGLTRAQSMAATDLQLAKTHTARRALQDNPRVVGHRRVLRGGSSCGLCVVASTQRYRKKELQPVHPFAIAGSCRSTRAGTPARSSTPSGSRVSTTGSLSASAPQARAPVAAV